MTNRMPHIMVSVQLIIVCVAVFTTTFATAQEQLKPKKPLPPKAPTVTPPTTATITATETTTTTQETASTLTESNVNVPAQTDEQISLVNGDNDDTNSTSSLPACELHCKNGGICNYMAREIDQLTVMVQSGRMIQQCSCPPGFAGMACEFALQQECNDNDGTCSNGMPCRDVILTTSKTTTTTEAAVTKSCDCADADMISKFAGMMCRKPYTEYCSDQFEPSEPQLSYCTNGGKCKSSFVGAQVSPGNVTVNNSYQHLGCVCPREFYGPHCELLQYSLIKESETTVMNNETQQDLEGAMPEDAFDFDDGFWERDSGSTSESSGTNTAAANDDDDDGDDKHSLMILFIVLVTMFASAVLCVTYYNCYYIPRRRQRRRKSDYAIGKTDESQSPDPPSESSNYDDDYLPIRRRHSPMAASNNCSNSMVYDDDIEHNEPLDSAPPPSVYSFYQDTPRGSKSMTSASSYHSSVQSASQKGRDHYTMPGAGNANSKSIDVDDDDDPSIIILHNEKDHHLDGDGSSHAPILVNPSMLDDENSEKDSMNGQNNHKHNNGQSNAERLFPLTLLGGGGEQRRRIPPTKSSDPGPFHFF